MKLTLCILLIFASGCTVIWTDDVFYCSIMNLKTFDHAKITDPNGLEIELENYRTEPKGRVLTPMGVVDNE